MANDAAVCSPDPIDVKVGLMTGRIRKKRGINQAALGEAVGVTFQQIQKYEGATNRVSASMLVRVARDLGVQPTDLLPKTDAAPLAPSAQLLNVRGAEELLESYAAIPSAPHRQAVLTLVRAMRETDPAGK